jgi:hypothetical protein
MDIEQEILATGPTAPRITPADIEANIASEWYINAGAAVIPDGFQPPVPAVHPLNLLTFCVLVLRNGFTVTGESACASPENFDAAIGRKVARQNAVAKIWPLMGYVLRSKLAAMPSDYRDRMREEKRELDEKITRLSAFVVTEKFDSLSFVEQANLLAQRTAMTAYSDILGGRIVASGGVVETRTTFDQLVQYGRDNGANIVNGMPWSFSFAGLPVTHENDRLYLVSDLRMEPGDVLVTAPNAAPRIEKGAA